MNIYTDTHLKFHNNHFRYGFSLQIIIEQIQDLFYYKILFTGRKKQIPFNIDVYPEFRSSLYFESAKLAKIGALNFCIGSPLYFPAKKQLVNALNLLKNEQTVLF